MGFFNPRYTENPFGDCTAKPEEGTRKLDRHGPRNHHSVWAALLPCWADDWGEPDILIPFTVDLMHQPRLDGKALLCGTTNHHMRFIGTCIGWEQPLPSQALVQQDSQCKQPRNQGLYSRWLTQMIEDFLNRVML